MQNENQNRSESNDNHEDDLPLVNVTDPTYQIDPNAKPPYQAGNVVSDSADAAFG